MASLAASDANAVVVDDAEVDVRPVVVGATAGNPALPARSATIVRIAGLAVLCATTLVAPAWLLVWMPIVLGVPHVASDVRYLVLPLPRRQVVVALAACAALVALKAASIASGVSLLRAEMVVVAFWLLAALALDRSTRRSHVLARHAQGTQSAAQSGRPTIRRGHGMWLAAAFAGLLIIALPIQFAILAAFAHNFVAIVAWVVVKRPARRHLVATLGTIAAAVAIIVMVGPAIAAATGGDASPWLTIDRAASVMFGGLPLSTARALMIAFAFLQAVHYAIWLDWIPRRMGGVPGTPYIHCIYGAAEKGSSVARRQGVLGAPYIHRINRVLGRAPSRVQRADVVGGVPFLRRMSLLVAATTLVVLGASLVDPAWTRTTYLSLATFHIYLELVLLAAMFARWRSARSPSMRRSA
jgi:hypothetical protein